VSPLITRRNFITVTASTVAGSCAGIGGSEPGLANDGRIAARPKTSVKPSAAGQRALGLDGSRDAILRIPPASSATLPLIVLLHGAGGSGGDILDYIGNACDEAAVAVLAPDSRDSTWDAIRDDFGRDVRFLNQALARVFESVAVDPRRIAIGGFSDGATYALSIGLINGDLFRRIVAFSPGFVVNGEPRGTPKIFVSHGTRDRILPIDRCSRQIVPMLKQRGYDVTFREFEGGHGVPPEIAREGISSVRTP
jgi:phospholipase/carboxylesterase